MNVQLKHLHPEPNVSLEPLEKIFWDYRYSLTGQDLYDFVLDKKDISYLDRDQVKARVLMTVGWYRLIDIFGLINLESLITDDSLQWVWVDELRAQYALAGKIIKRLLT
ncbi:MAG: hypothetical protein ACM3SY_06180 [Candidatus Omnitrophota bacterium]